MRQPAVFVASTTTTVVTHLSYRLLDVDRGLSAWSTTTLYAVAVTVALRFWVGVSIWSTALDVLRTDGTPSRFRWASLSATLQVAVVTAALALLVIVGTVPFIVPGVWLAVRWSQAPMLIADGRAEWFAAAGDSAHVVNGRRLEILSVWLIVAAVLMVAAWMSTVLADIAAAFGASVSLSSIVSLLIKVPADAFCLTVVAATYFELDREVAVECESSPARRNLDTPHAEVTDEAAHAWDGWER